MTLGGLTFLAPLTLLGLLVLPLIWWLLRVTPPSPKKETFPPLRILQDVVTEEETPDSTPWWLLLFRIAMGAIIAIALARPILQQAEGITTHPLTLIIDDGWDAAPNWSNVIREAEAKISDARRKNVDVLLLTTAQPTAEPKFVPAQDAMRAVKALRPQAIAPQRGKAAKALETKDLSGSDAVWLSSGIGFGQSDSLAKLLGSAAKATRLDPLSDMSVLVPGETRETPDGFKSVWHRTNTSGLRSAEIIASGKDGRVIGRADINFAPGVSRAEASFILPSELRSRVSQIRANGVASAGAVKLLDDSWGRPLIGVVTPAKDSATPLLSEPFYAKTALAPYADIFEGTIEDLLPLSPSIIIMPDVSRTINEEVENYVKTGGLLIRFAGEKLAERPDSLLPVALRGGGRALGGALTWQDPQRLASFNSESPFFGLSIPDDITVRRQVMAEPGTETDIRTWARLEDGSPIVTSSTEGLGRLVLFHVTAGPDWSNLPVGGLYVEMLRRILPLARATPGRTQDSTGDWVPERVLNGFGRLEAPPVEASSISDEAFATTTITPKTLPGLYRQGARRQALNTVKDVEALKSIGNTANMSIETYGQTKDRTIGGWLLGAALLMLALDALFALSASGRMAYLKPKIGKSAAALILAAILMIPSETYAQDQTPDKNLDAATALHLAYVKTGIGRVDRMSETAMESLARQLTARTTIEPAGAKGVNPEKDDLIFYPFLYWPVTRDAQSLSDEASANLNAYMAGGGTIVFDTQDEGERVLRGGETHPGMAAITANLDIPALTQAPEEHVLTKSFYLLQTFPGRWANGPVWVDRDNNGAARDGVSSVILGSNDWAAGWAIDEDGNDLAELEKDIPRQREMSIRFGVNVAMYALSGNYKADQVHAAALVERLGRQKREPQDLGKDGETTP
ncbi:DUF4159 domain-containing protein [Hellea balneolensis]|uniref:DUF4159 domain-containing protein n=1 Tax=Hellea balneolensis TaxID=287478 RepID=UPI0004245EF7|nr:DUF4159 domain-containing protein [Hellea balneolensis]